MRLVLRTLRLERLEGLRAEHALRLGQGARLRSLTAQVGSENRRRRRGLRRASSRSRLLLLRRVLAQRLGGALVLFALADDGKKGLRAFLADELSRLSRKLLLLDHLGPAGAVDDLKHLDVGIRARLGGGLHRLDARDRALRALRHRQQAGRGRLRLLPRLVQDAAQAARRSGHLRDSSTRPGKSRFRPAETLGQDLLGALKPTHPLRELSRVRAELVHARAHGTQRVAHEVAELSNDDEIGLVLSH